MMRGEFARTRYGRVAWIYDLLTALSGGGIERARNAFLGRLPFAPKNPLIIGCGAGAFPVAFAKAENPGLMTVNDLAPQMLARTRLGLAKSGWKGRLVALEGDIAALALHAEYDLIVLQFVLTCFDQATRIRFLGQVQRLLAPGGLLLISDYSRPREAWLMPLFYLNYWASVLLLWPLAGNPPNRPGDIERAILAAGFRVSGKHSFTAGLYSAWLLSRD